MRRLATPEHDRDLYLGALVQEALDVSLLGVVVMDADLRAELDLLDVDLALVLPSLLRLLFLLVLVLAVVHDLRDRRVGLRGNLDEIEILGVGVLPGFVSGLDSELSSIVVNQADIRHADVLVDARRVPVDGPLGLERPASRPQRLITKLGLLLLDSIPDTEKPLHAAAPFQVVPTQLNPTRTVAAAGGEERVRPCFSDGQRSKLCHEFRQRFRGLAASALADCQAFVALPVAEDDDEGDLLELRGPDPLADRLRRLTDVDAVALGAQALGDRGSGAEVRLTDRQEPHLDGRDPEGERPGEVLGEDADEALEGAEERPVDDVGHLLFIVGRHIGAAEALRRAGVELDRPALPRAAERVLDVQVDLR